MSYTNETRPDVFKRLDANGSEYYADSEIINVPGLYYIANYISKEEEDEFMRILDSRPWNHDIQRRTQYYGYTYYHTRHNIVTMQPVDQPNQHTGTLDDFQALIDRLMKDKIFPPDHPPTQILVNEYIQRMGIKGHVDNTDAFGDVIISLSMNGPSYMTMRSIENPNIAVKVFMEERSVLIMSGDARFKWRHAITKQSRIYIPTTGQTVIRDDTYRRISLTIREIKIEGTKRITEDEPDLGDTYKNQRIFNSC